MRPQPLNAARILTVVSFALTCFCLLLFLWNAFGGPVPLKPKGYRVTLALPEADLLSTQADVRISGVTIGRVVTTERTTSRTDPNRKDAVLEIDHQYAPLRRDTRAMIRRKSLAGEEYLELTPGGPTAPAIPDGGRLANANVAPSVEIDEVLRAFDEPTRRAFGRWVQEQAVAVSGRGDDLNAAFGNLPAFEQDFTKVLEVLNRQRAAVQAAVRNTGAVFDALSVRRDALHGAIVNTKRVTDAFAAQSAAFADTWRAFPPFEKSSQELLHRAERFRQNADPVLTQLRPGFREFGPAMQQVRAIAPDLNGLLHGVDGLNAAGVRGLPAARRFFERLRPFTQEWVPFLAQLTPILAYAEPNVDALNSAVADLTAATQATTAGYGDGPPLHYARGGLLLEPSALSLYDHRLPTNRSNPYDAGRQRFSATQPFSVFNDGNCGPITFPKLGPADPAKGLDQVLIDRIRHFALNDDQPVAPPCLLQQTPGGTRFPQVQALSQKPEGAR